MDWMDVLRRLAQGLPLQPAPSPGGVGDTTEALPADWMTLSPPVAQAPGTIPQTPNLQGMPFPRSSPKMPDMANSGWGFMGGLPTELAPPRLRGSLPQSLLPGEIMQTYLEPQPVVNDNAGDRNQLSEQELLEQLMQQILRQNQTIWPGPMQQPTNTQDPPRLRLVQNDNAGQRNTLTAEELLLQALGVQNTPGEQRKFLGFPTGMTKPANSPKQGPVLVL